MTRSQKRELKELYQVKTSEFLKSVQSLSP